MLFLAIIIILIVLFCLNKKYKKSSYYQITKYPYLSVRYNTGRYGEYLTYKNLKHMETSGAKFLFNVYIPKENGETSEIDVLMICSKGIFVFESKNYSGWIFGSENQKNWYQTLPAGRGRSHKEHFYNPIIQNRSHIKHLKSFLGEEIPMRSIIVFSDRCTLKNIQIESNDINVTKRYNVASVVSAICNQAHNNLLNENHICNIYNTLYPFTQVDETVKLQHIANIHNTQNIKSIIHSQPAYTPPVISQQEEIKPVEATQSNVIVNELSHPVDIVKESNGIEPQVSKNLKCPWCNGNLILRRATRGANAGNQFYGCSNYPKCKYIQNINQKAID